jgi:hypothetical protein
VFNSSEDKEVVLRESIQMKLEEEIVSCGGEFPLRGVQWCRISDIKQSKMADMALMWSDMIVNINLESDGSNILGVLIQAIMALKINSKVQSGHAVNINMPHAFCHSPVADVVFHFREFINSSKLTIGVSNPDKNELFQKELPAYQKIEVNTETLVSSYQSAILEIPGAIYSSNTEYYVKDGVFGVAYTPALLCQLMTDAMNDIEIYCLGKSLQTEDKACLEGFLNQELNSGFDAFLPFTHELKLLSDDEPEFDILKSLQVPTKERITDAKVTFLTSIFKGDDFFSRISGKYYTVFVRG